MMRLDLGDQSFGCVLDSVSPVYKNRCVEVRISLGFLRSKLESPTRISNTLYLVCLVTLAMTEPVFHPDALAQGETDSCI